MSNSSCYFRKHKSVFLQILHQYSVLSKITLLYLFSSNILCFGQKQLLKVQVFEIFQCSGENLPKSSCHFLNRKEVFLQILHDSSLSWKITPQYSFRSKIIYFAQKDQSKCKFWRLLSVWIKIQQIRFNFATTNWFLFKFCINLQYHDA